MWVRSKWGFAALVAWPSAALAQEPSTDPAGGANQDGKAAVNVGTAKLPDVDASADAREPTPAPAPATQAPQPVTRLLGPNDNPYRGPSIPDSNSFENPYRGPSLKQPYDNPYRGPSRPAESALPAAPEPPSQAPHWGPPDYCPPGGPCAAARRPGVDQPAPGARLSAEQRAVQGSPFINAVSGAFLLRDRVGTPLAFGGELGAFVLERLRLSGRALVPIVSPTDEIPGQGKRASRSIWLWGFAAGLVVAQSPSFTLSPGLQYVRVAGGRHGNAVGAHVPFEWLLESGLRVGFDFSVLYGFGGSYRIASCGATLDDECTEESQGRAGAPGVALNLILGQAFTSEGANRAP